MEGKLEQRMRALSRGRAPGVALVVVAPDGTLAEAATGFSDLGTCMRASTRMVCPWFSMTKVVTATVVLAQSDAGRLDLDAPVLPRVPALARLEPRAWAGRLTARHLLSHSAGLANPIPVRWIHPADSRGPEPDAFLEKLLEKHPRLRFEPGTRASYTNLGYLVLGALVAAVEGSPFIDATRRRVLDPLAMSGSGFSVEPEPHADATGYHPRTSPLRWLLPRWVRGPAMGRWVALRPFRVDGVPYGGLVGPVAEAARFCRMHLRDGELDGARILSPGAARAMREVRTGGRNLDLGLGWFRPAAARAADPPFVQHLGGGAGFFNVMRLYPTRRRGVVVMGNATRYDVEAIAALALEV